MSRHLFTYHYLTGRTFKDNPPNEQADNDLKACGFNNFKEYGEWKATVLNHKNE